jgi:hypothetical protein
MKDRFSPAYRKASALVVVQQVLLGLIAGMMLDGGALGSIFLYSLVAFWVVFVIIVVRRPRNPTKTDIFLIKWGTFLLFAVSFVLSLVIWRMRGAM